MKTRYSIYDAKTHLSEIIRLVRRDRSVVITDRGHEVARVVPIEKSTGFEKRISDLTHSGVISAHSDADPGKIAPIATRPGALKRFLDNRSRY